MRKAVTLLLSVCCFYLLSQCDVMVDREKPYPLDVENEYWFDTNYQGKYLSNADTTLLIITSQHLIKAPYQIYAIPYSEVVKSPFFEYKNDSLFSPKNKKIWLPASVLRDTVFAISYHYDTLFNISPHHVLRYEKGQYFLNYQLDSTKWKVEILQKKGDRLKIYHINYPKNEKELEKIIETDSLGNNIKISARQLRKLLKSGKYHTTDLYEEIMESN